MENIYVIKIGGNVIDDENSLKSFLQDFAKIPAKKILVHGGGKVATKIGEQLNIKPNYINGRRITDKDTIDLVTMVYGGLLNKKIVAQLQSLSCNAIGLTGADANLIPATIRPVTDIDYGYVGDVDNYQLSIINYQLFLNSGLTPVFAPLTHDGKGQILNTNADTVASVMAIALSAVHKVRLIYCFEKKGVLNDINDGSSVIGHINKSAYEALTAQNKLHDGMIPKMQNAFNAIDKGVQEIVIGDAKDLLQNISQNNSGTLITA
jgi:acetylglutamate kinase